MKFEGHQDTVSGVQMSDQNKEVHTEVGHVTDQKYPEDYWDSIIKNV